MDWTYSVTFESSLSTSVNAEEAVQALEPQLLANMLDLLDCESSEPGKLAENTGIVGMDFKPQDSLEEGKIRSRLFHCTFHTSLTIFHQR